MPNLMSNEVAFLSLVKSLQKGKGKENVSTDILSQAKSYNKEYKVFTSAPPMSDTVKEQASWPVEQPATMGSQERSVKASSVDPPRGVDGIVGNGAHYKQQPATYTVIASNFAPETTAADIMAATEALLDENGKMQDCKIISERPTVVAEMVFVEKIRAESVIDAFNGQMADGRLLHVYFKPSDTSTQPEAPHKDMDSPQSEEDAVGGASLIEQQPPSPILRGRGRNRYASPDGFDTVQAGPGTAAASSSEKTKDAEPEMATVRTKTYTRETVRSLREEEELASLKVEYERQEAEAAAEEEALNEAEIARAIEEDVNNADKEAEEAKAARFQKLTEEKNRKRKDRGAAQSLNDSTQQAVARKPVDPVPALNGTINEDTVGIPTAMEVPASSRITLAEPTTPNPALQIAPSSKPSTLLSNGHEFLQALSKRSHPPTPVATTAAEAQVDSLPEGVLPEELPMATATRQGPFNGQARSPSPVTQITTTGTLLTPSGEHIIHLAPQLSPIDSNIAPEKDTTLPTKLKANTHSISYSLSHNNASPSSPTPPHENLTSPTHHLHLSPPNHPGIPPRPRHQINGSTTPTPPAARTLTLLSGSGRRGYVYAPRRYDSQELVKIGKAYWQKVFLALLDREGRGRLVVGVMEG
ncbi:MAG: hypothetical protein Q9213_008271 [Squamulea squamosa]